MCAVTGSGPYMVELLMQGTCSLTASQAGDGNHQPASATMSFTVSLQVIAPQSIPSGSPFSRVLLLLGMLLLAGGYGYRRRLI